MSQEDVDAAVSRANRYRELGVRIAAIHTKLAALKQERKALDSPHTWGALPRSERLRRKQVMSHCRLRSAELQREVGRLLQERGRLKAQVQQERRLVEGELARRSVLGWITGLGNDPPTSPGA